MASRAPEAEGLSLEAGRRAPRCRTPLSSDRRDGAAAPRPERSSVAQRRATVTRDQVVALLELRERFKRAAPNLRTTVDPPTSILDARPARPGTQWHTVAHLLDWRGWHEVGGQK
ncbi:MAG: hypothetical protein M1815_000817 [Lichina confinis]|nr:MAG: hypothetical protein M1815_000817 [Lichina confinis]